VSLLDRLDAVLAGTAQAASTPRGAQRLRQHLMATLLCPERCTLTNLLCTGGFQHQDWSAHYRCYSHRRIDTHLLFHQVCHEVQQALRAYPVKESRGCKAVRRWVMMPMKAR
jgi:hypothetical protein